MWFGIAPGMTPLTTAAAMSGSQGRDPNIIDPNGTSAGPAPADSYLLPILGAGAGYLFWGLKGAVIGGIAGTLLKGSPVGADAQAAAAQAVADAQAAAAAAARNALSPPLPPQGV